MNAGEGPKSFILATAGHVDHGKTALVRALTGTDTDRLPEEKKRGITIDLGFAHLSLPPYSIGVVDVPGHEDFVKNMVAGVGSIDLALLVVAADDLWMPQTEEHLQILEYLGVGRGVVALTKADLTEDVEQAMRAVRGRLRGSLLADADIVPTSVVTGSGIEGLRKALVKALDQTPLPGDIHKPRLPVDRVFTLKGIGTVITGTLTGGRLQRGQKVLLQAVKQPAHIRGIQTHNQDVEEAVQGSRVALNLPELAVAERRSNRQAKTIARGDVVTIEGVGEASNIVDVLIERSGRAGGVERGLASNTVVRVHHGSAAVAGRLRLLGRQSLEIGEKGIARLVLESPLFGFAGDRFIVRDWPEQHTLAGGVILHPRPGDRPDLELLRARAAAPMEIGVYVATELAMLRITQRVNLLRQSRFPGEDLQRCLEKLLQQGRAKSLPEGLVADAAFWADLLEKVGHAVDGHHQEHPERAGLAAMELSPLLPAGFSITQILAGVPESGFVVGEGVIRRADHRLTLPPRLAPAAKKILATLAGRPFDPPSKKELAGDDLAMQAMKFLVATGEVVEVSAELILGAQAQEQARAKVGDYLLEHGEATVSQLKTVLGSSRRVMVPLLEYFDRTGLTRRKGDLRVLK